MAKKRADRVVVMREQRIVYGAGVDYKTDWRWTRYAPNGEIVGASTEGYRRKIDCLANAKRCMVPCEIA